MTTPDTRDAQGRELGLVEMLEERRIRAERRFTTDPETGRRHHFVHLPEDEFFAYLDVIRAAERRRQAIAEREELGKVMFDTQYGYVEWLRSGDRWNQAESDLTAALDRLAAHLAGASDEERT
jgi:hypothetical protein